MTIISPPMNPIACLVASTAVLGLAVPLHAQVDWADWSTSAFFEAAEISDVTRCLQAGPNPGARYEGGLTPLHVAAATGNAEAIAALADAGANLEAREENGITPLYMAAAFGNAEVIATLAAAGAEPYPAEAAAGAGTAARPGAGLWP